MKAREINFIRALVIGSMACSAILLLVLAIVRGMWSTAGAAGLIMTVVAVLSWPFIDFLRKRKQAIEWMLTLAVINLFVVVPEVTLRLVRFRYQSSVQFGYPRPQDYFVYETDEKLFWKRKHSEPGVNSLGFNGKEVVVPKPKNTFRMLYLGDSVTFQGYPDSVAAYLNDRFPESPRKFESITLALPGYSSYQGRVLADMYGSEFEPDIVFVYFGWNDHWQAYRTTDANKKIKTSNSAIGQVTSFVYDKSRLFQKLNSVRNSVMGYDTPIADVRVSPSDYRYNLGQIQLTFKRQGVPVIFITAPTSHYDLGVPEYLIEMRFARDKQSVMKMHREYNQILREVAAGDNCFLLDLEKELSSGDDLKQLFMEDGIHFLKPGLRIVGGRIANFISTELKLAHNQIFEGS